MTTPVLISTHPVDNAQQAVLQTHIVLRFDQPVKAGTGVITLVSPRGSLTIAINDTTQVLILGDTVIINPFDNLAAGTTYNLDIPPGAITDLAGVPFGGITDPTGLNFTTAPPAGNDLNGDGLGDLMFRDSQSGQTVIWYSRGNGAYTPVALIAVTPDWAVVDAADFTGDGRSDLLWRNTAGEVVTWDSTGNFITGRYLGAVPTTFRIEQAADFTGDGKADILWRNTSNGQVTLWTSGPDNTFGSAVVGTIGQDWKALAAGDFNGDGKDDLLWSNPAGIVAIWSGNGTAFNTAVGQNLDPSWTVLGTGDIDLNSTDDILMVNASGEVRIWFGEPDGFTVRSVAVVDAGWTFEQICDMNGDGRADIVWRAPNGDVMLWTAQLAEGVFTTDKLASIPNEWGIF